MIMTVAILTKRGMLCSDLQEDTDMNIFKLGNGKVIEYENVKLRNKEYQSFVEVLITKKINLLYMNDINKEFEKILKGVGCLSKSKENFDGDEFINRFIFS